MRTTQHPLTTPDLKIDFRFEGVLVPLLVYPRENPCNWFPQGGGGSEIAISNIDEKTGMSFTVNQWGYASGGRLAAYVPNKDQAACPFVAA